MFSATVLLLIGASLNAAFAKVADEENACLKSIKFSVDDSGTFNYQDSEKSCFRNCIFDRQFPDPKRNPVAFNKTAEYKIPLVRNCSSASANLTDRCERGNKLEQCYVAGMQELNSAIYQECYNITNTGAYLYKAEDMYCHGRCVSIKSGYMKEDNTLVIEPESKTLKDQIDQIYKENKQTDVCFQAFARKTLIEKATKEEAIQMLFAEN